MTTTYDKSSAYWLQKGLMGCQPFVQQMILPNIKSHDVAVDIGCGGGRLAVALQPYLRCYGVDFSAKLIEETQKQHPHIVFHHGDVELPSGWACLPNFNVVVSNCAIRKDGCRLEKIVPMIRRFAQQPVKLFFRIQGDGDLPGWVKNPPFYGKDEILTALNGFEVCVETETYEQGFSSQGYLRKFMERINIQPNESAFDSCKKGRIRIKRQYFLVRAIKKHKNQ